MNEEKQTLIGEFDKNSVETVKVHLQKWGQGVYCDIRVWATPAAGDLPGLHPTKKGITLAAEQLPDLLKLLEEARRVIEKGEEPAPDVGEKGR